MTPRMRQLQHHAGTPVPIARVATAFIIIYVGFDRLASLLGSTRGEQGLVVCSVVLGLIVLAERQLSGLSLGDSARSLGLGASAGRALAAGTAISLGLLAGLPLLASVTGTPLEVRDGAAWLAIGLFAQGGVAEETLFRGFMYRHVRRNRTFWRAACVSAVPFTMAHVPLLFALAPAVALLSLAMALALSFPLAWLFDRAQGSIWPGAILHATLQGSLKVLADDAATFQTMALAWVALGMTGPWLVFLLPEPAAERAR